MNMEMGSEQKIRKRKIIEERTENRLFRIE